MKNQTKTQNLLSKKQFIIGLIAILVVGIIGAGVFGLSTTTDSKPGKLESFGCDPATETLNASNECVATDDSEAEDDNDDDASAISFNNSGRSADISQLAAAISSYSGSRNGKLPPTIVEVTHVTGSELGWDYYEFVLAATDTVATNHTGTKANPGADKHKLTYFSFTTGTTPHTPASVEFLSLPTPDEVHIWAGYKCTSDNLPAGNPDASTNIKYKVPEHLTDGINRDVAIVYQLEGQATALCFDYI